VHVPVYAARVHDRHECVLHTAKNKENSTICITDGIDRPPSTHLCGPVLPSLFQSIFKARACEPHVLGAVRWARLSSGLHSFTRSYSLIGGRHASHTMVIFAQHLPYPDVLYGSLVPCPLLPCFASSPSLWVLSFVYALLGWCPTVSSQGTQLPHILLYFNRSNHARSSTFGTSLKQVHNDWNKWGRIMDFSHYEWP
jgi:hypothetical protein